MTRERAMTTELFAEKTASIICAFAGKNALQHDELPGFVRAVYKALSKMDEPPSEEATAPNPAVNPKRSVFPDYIICLENGKKFKSLKRHLAAKYQMTPDEYREKWGLGAHYPMIAPNYARKRAELAKTIGFTPRNARETESKTTEKTSS